MRNPLTEVPELIKEGVNRSPFQFDNELTH